LHDREIVQRSDDSVVRQIGGKIYPIRRARGFVPAPVLLKTRGAPGLKKTDVAGLGGELKSTFCILKEGFAYLSQHLGDLDQPSVREFYAKTFGFFREFLDAKLAAVCRDLHPAYFTTSFADSVEAGRVLSSSTTRRTSRAAGGVRVRKGRRGLLRRHGVREDGAIWGGEFFSIDGMEMRRAAALDDFPLQEETPPSGSRENRGRLPPRDVRPGGGRSPSPFRRNRSTGSPFWSMRSRRK
jgi:hydrogenase maturation protein HypF